MRARLALPVLFLCALALRPQLVAVGPLVPLIAPDLGMSFAAAGLLASVPLLSLGLFAIPGPRVSSILGPRDALTACLLVVGSFGIVRAWAPDAAWLVALTIPLGIAMGLSGTVLPGYVKQRFPTRPAFATGVYTSGYQISSGLTSLLVVPIALIAGGWRSALLAVSLLAVVVLIAWVLLTDPDDRTDTEARRADRVRLPWRSGLVWVLALAFGFRSIVFQGLAVWLPAAYVERGWSEASAATLVFLLTACSLPVTVLVSWAADRRGSRRQYLTVASVVLTAAMIGLAAVPGAVVVWVVAIGAALGVLFPLTLTLPLDVADTPTGVAAVASLMLAGGYAIGALGPLLLGTLRDAVGSFEPAFVTLAVLSVLILVVTLYLSPERLAERAAHAHIDAIAET
jgi:CP family cyanate transporter-like MFS transporter